MLSLSCLRCDLHYYFFTLGTLTSEFQNCSGGGHISFFWSYSSLEKMIILVYVFSTRDYWPGSSSVVQLLSKKIHWSLSSFPILLSLPSQCLHFPGENAWEPAAKLCLHASVCLFFNIIGNMPRSMWLCLRFTLSILAHTEGIHSLILCIKCMQTSLVFFFFL